MRLGLFLGVVCALLLHGAVLLFGGALLVNHKKDYGTLQQVDLLSTADTADKDKPKDKPETEKNDEMKAQDGKPPDAAEIIHNLEQPAALNAPKLDAASLSAIEAALSGQMGGGGDFTSGMDFSSGGRIGGSGKPGAQQQGIDQAFNMSEIDQQPRVVFQAAPVYPGSMHSVEGVVTLVFTVDPTGKVLDPRVEKSTHHEFDKPALDAVKQWKFEPAIRAGQRVSARMRVPIRFQPR